MFFRNSVQDLTPLLIKREFLQSGYCRYLLSCCVKLHYVHSVCVLVCLHVFVCMKQVKEFFTICLGEWFNQFNSSWKH